MRGKPQAQPGFMAVINLNKRVLADHPLRGIKEQVNQVVKIALIQRFPNMAAGGFLTALSCDRTGMGSLSLQCH
jgi:hypothetical protein